MKKCTQIIFHEKHSNGDNTNSRSKKKQAWLKQEYLIWFLNPSLGTFTKIWTHFSWILLGDNLICWASQKYWKPKNLVSPWPPLFPIISNNSFLLQKWEYLHTKNLNFFSTENFFQNKVNFFQLEYTMKTPLLLLKL